MVPCMCVCVCIKRTRTWTITCTQTYMPAHPFHPFGSIRIQWHSHTHTQMHTCTHTHMHACIRIYWHIHTHTYTYMHLYTHTTHTFLRWSYMHILAHTYIQTDRQTYNFLAVPTFSPQWKLTGLAFGHFHLRQPWASFSMPCPLHPRSSWNVHERSQVRDGQGWSTLVKLVPIVVGVPIHIPVQDRFWQDIFSPRFNLCRCEFCHREHLNPRRKLVRQEQRGPWGFAGAV